MRLLTYFVHCGRRTLLFAMTDMNKLSQKKGWRSFYVPSMRVTGLEEHKRKTSTPVKVFSRPETEGKSPLM